ncbi:hypothetical protein F8158_22345 [Bacillus cereus]|uniref:Transposase n=1 Tax=Bacillus cereus TaxID=1396 RepID=A0AB34D2T0_BACCE|nr:hypothetical protein F8158_22345 [Bacillus cereus]
MVHKIKFHGKIYVSILLSPHMLRAFFIDIKSLFQPKKRHPKVSSYDLITTLILIICISQI